jgi:hypothetical protein
MDGRDSIPGRGRDFFLSITASDQLWCPPGLLSIVTGGSTPGGKAAGA